MSEPGNIPVRVEGLSKSFRQGETIIEALMDISMTVEQGDFVAVMGASGSGKSTLLHLLAGLTKPDNGKVFIDGENIFSMSDYQLTVFRRRRIGIVFQAFNLIPSLSAADNIMLPLFADGRGRDSKGELDELLTKLEISSRRTHRPDALSGGEQQRVAIARALITSPSIILADEPTGSLDSVNGQRLCRILKTLCEERSRTIVLVTHEPAVAIWSKRIVVLKDGRILKELKTSDYKDSHALAADYQDLVSVKDGIAI
ncbi:MAG: peptide ABC transporter ATP-binding protein [Lentisphaerae bacterium GWF2_52_8]|nr:MAG: peptide ABC transporter ATP-binding protein [Lentisphaerae bacterium GWF2_52_8]